MLFIFTQKNVSDTEDPNDIPGTDTDQHLEIMTLLYLVNEVSITPLFHPDPLLECRVKCLD